MSRTLGYFLSWGTYGTRLNGDPRGTVNRTDAFYGDPVLGPDEERWEYERGKMKIPPVVLTREQRLFAQDHVHVVLTSTHEPKTIRRILKRWLGQELSAKWPLPEGATWWAECGSIRWLNDDGYFQNAVGYVTRQRTC